MEHPDAGCLGRADAFVRLREAERVKAGLCESAPKTGRAFTIAQWDARDRLQLRPRGLQANATAPREDSVQPSNCPTQAKIGLGWAIGRQALQGYADRS